jgi:hypothetical protein
MAISGGGLIKVLYLPPLLDTPQVRQKLIEWANTNLIGPHEISIAGYRDKEGEPRFLFEISNLSHKTIKRSDKNAGLYHGIVGARANELLVEAVVREFDFMNSVMMGMRKSESQEWELGGFEKERMTPEKLEMLADDYKVEDDQLRELGWERATFRVLTFSAFYNLLTDALQQPSPKQSKRDVILERLNNLGEEYAISLGPNVQVVNYSETEILNGKVPMGQPGEIFFSTTSASAYTYTGQGWVRVQ